MGRYPCCKDDDDSDLKKGPWTEDEDEKLTDYINKNGHTNWTSIARKAGLKRCGKSCRLRWNNYLRPDIKRGGFSHEEEETIINLHSVLGNKWSRIAAHLPGRTDNEIKNFYNTHLRKKLLKLGIDPKTHKPITHLNSLIDLSNQFTSNSNYFVSLASALRLHAHFTLLAKIQQLLQSPLSSTNTTFFSPMQGNFNTTFFSPMQGNFLGHPIGQAERSQFLNSSLANFTITRPCLDNTPNSLRNYYSSISNSLEVPSEKFDKIETIQRSSAWPLYEGDMHKSRNGANSSEYFQASELNLNADHAECSIPSLVPSTSENSNLDQNCIPKFSELDDIDAWEIPHDDEAISSFWNTIFQ